MKTGPRGQGFTIVETLIVLAVTSAMFLMAALAINGKQGRTEFTTGIRSMQQQIQQVMDEVASGYYPSLNNVTCTAGGSGPVVRDLGTTVEQGTNSPCIFLGKVIQFNADNTDPEQYKIYTMAALRTPVTGTGLNLSDVKPKVIAASNADNLTPNNLFDTKKMPYGQKVAYVRYSNGGSTVDIGSIGFAANLGSLDDTNRNSQVNVLAIPNTQRGQPQGSEVDVINTNLATSIQNPDNGIQICINSGGSDQSGLLTIGGSGKQVSVSVDIKTGLNCP